MGFTTLYGCLFCEKVHGSKDSISQHLDAHLTEFRRGRPVPTLDAQDNHPAAIIRAARSLRKGRKKDPLLTKPMRAERLPLRDECSLWNLVIELSSSSEVRAHLNLDRTELDNAFWMRFVDAGLKPNGGSDPRVGTGWKEHLEREAEIARFRAIVLGRAAEQQEARLELAARQHRIDQEAKWHDAEWEDYQDDAVGDDEQDQEQDDEPEEHAVTAQDEEVEPQVAQGEAGEVAKAAVDEVDVILQRIADVNENLAGQDHFGDHESPSLSASEKGKAKEMAETTSPDKYLPSHLAKDPECYYRDGPSSGASSKTNVISGTNLNGLDSGCGSLAGNNGPISFHKDASIISTRDHTIKAPLTPQRARKRTANSPLPNPRTDAATPRAGNSAIDITLRMLDTNTTVKVRSRDSLQSVIMKLRAEIPSAISDGLSGLSGAGTPPGWALMERADWAGEWSDRTWANVKARGGAQIPLQEVRVEGVWRFL